MKLGTFTKQPRERRSYSITYEDVMDQGDNVKSVELLSVAPTGLVIEPPFIADPRIKFFAEGGVTGTSYTAVFLVETEDGQKFEDEVVIKVKEVA